ncbi:16S rRNA (adenine(1518)-N(6)/adenine(1519)-N(6))-dimethyltransferase RsmA [Ornithobacterium rhinotracheale]|uniref:Ribosomal RNA small subunit methyltransferase A n=1 Tax=Ornithobacterium rhinotracheale TaxID=28251 RepID=A0A3R5XUK5_ORNRH|nr:16S rRNA (adenine(1518)-N(6)/adenine(1519)-N(6))-dimethyltransferase RsmA [Ornithobacterium rhinotracheale]QAR31546.1 16S rRNA (adenine(1518)-N(6)/adenine(1519)-N(6))-dimethyltransferase RsmA [Ornithobacterium rhinotracheale]
MNVKAKKHLGQHFLNDLNIAEKIVEALTWEDYSEVLEIGPGMGVLTQFLLREQRPVSVVEIDAESVAYLNEKYNGVKQNLPIFSEDFLKMNLSQHFHNPIAVIGNFPYNISTQIMFKVLENKGLIPQVVGMFQKEVAERIAAPHGSKVYGILSVLVQAYYRAEYLFTVDENVFTPPPKVKSGVIRLTRFREEIEGVPYAFFLNLVKTAFNQRRKKLSNALKSLNQNELLASLKYKDLRAEQLSVEDFIELAKILYSTRG